MNKEYQVLIWKGYEFEEQLGTPYKEVDFDTYKEALSYYNRPRKYMCKMIMRYESPEPDADGEVIIEEWI